MNPLAGATAVVVFEPGPGWSWRGWDGRVDLNVRRSISTANNNSLGLARDAEALALELAGRSYVATGFDAQPGSVLIARVMVNPASLSRIVTFDGLNCLDGKTTGNFGVVCSPSFGYPPGPSPPPPDPNPSKTGTFSVEATGQAAALAQY